MQVRALKDFYDMLSNVRSLFTYVHNLLVFCLSFFCFLGLNSQYIGLRASMIIKLIK